MNPVSRHRYDMVAFMGAICLFFSTLEYLIPKPVPFFRLGLANLPVLLSLAIFTPGDVLLLVTLKVVGQGLVNGTLASYVFLFSLAGSFASAGVMLAAYRVGGRLISLVGVSVAGALASNVVQTALSVTFIFGQNAWVIAPLFLAIGVGSGLVIGIVAQRFSIRSRFLAQMGERYGA